MKESIPYELDSKFHSIDVKTLGQASNVRFRQSQEQRRAKAHRRQAKLDRAHSKKGGIFFALKGLYIPAQGNALGR